VELIRKGCQEGRMRKYVLAGDSEKLPKVSKVLKFEGGNK